MRCGEDVVYDSNVLYKGSSRMSCISSLIKFGSSVYRQRPNFPKLGKRKDRSDRNAITTRARDHQPKGPISTTLCHSVTALPNTTRRHVALVKCGSRVPAYTGQRRRNDTGLYAVAHQQTHHREADDIYPAILARLDSGHTDHGPPRLENDLQPLCTQLDHTTDQNHRRRPYNALGSGVGGKG